MRSLREKLLLSYALLLLGILGGAGWSIYYFGVLGQSVRLILQNNYRSVLDAQRMKEALERQDSAMLFYIASDESRAVQQYEANRQQFARHLADAADNITETGEADVVRDIGAQFTAYSQRAQAFLHDSALSSDGRRQVYFSELEPAFVRLKTRSDDLLQLNQEAMVRAQHRAEQQAAGARRAAILLALGVLVVGSIYAVNLSRALVAPLRHLAVAAERIGEGNLDTRIEVRTRDEVETLATAFNSMVDRLRVYRDREAARLQVAEEKSDAVLNSLYEPVIVTGAQGEVIGFNRSAGTVLNSATTWINQPVEVIGIPAVATAVHEAIEKRSPVAPEGERGLARIPVDGTERFYRVRTAPVVQQTGTVIGTVTVLEDMTRTRQLDRMKDDFISVASHELRTPLTSMQLAVQLLAEGSAGPLSPAQDRLVHIAAADAQRLERLTRDLLDLTRLEAGTGIPAPHPIRPRDIVETAIEPLRAVAAEKAITLSADVDPGLPSVLGSREHLSRAVTNLVDNALRHTPPGGRVDVRARVIDHAVEFTVADTGEGIPSEYLAHLFERFVQVPGASSGGAGLGLSIVRRIVEAHRGTIGAESSVGQGSRFHFTIPLASASLPGAAPPTVEGGAH